MNHDVTIIYNVIDFLKYYGNLALLTTIHYLHDDIMFIKAGKYSDYFNEIIVALSIMVITQHSLLLVNYSVSSSILTVKNKL